MTQSILRIGKVMQCNKRYGTLMLEFPVKSHKKTQAKLTSLQTENCYALLCCFSFLPSTRLGGKHTIPRCLSVNAQPHCCCGCSLCHGGLHYLQFYQQELSPGLHNHLHAATYPTATVKPGEKFLFIGHCLISTVIVHAIPPRTRPNLPTHHQSGTAYSKKQLPKTQKAARCRW